MSYYERGKNKNCNDPNFPCLDDNSRCLSKNGETLMQFLQKQKIKDRTVGHYSLESRGEKNFPKFLKSKVFEFSSCDEIRKYLSLNKSLISEMDEGNWKSLLRNIKINGFDYEIVKKNLNNLAEKNPKYYKKIKKDLDMNFFNYGTKNKEYCLIYYFKCIYKKLFDKYTIVDKNTWYESIRRKNSVNDYKYFDYFTDTTSIGDNAFKKEKDLFSIIIPDSVVSIGEAAFLGCIKIMSVTFPEGLASIGSKAFSNCIGLNSLTFPASLTSIGESAFYQCIGLYSVIFPVGSALTSIKRWVFLGCKYLESITFPAGMTTIGNGALASCHRLTSVTFPAGSALTTIQHNAFANCSRLTSLTFPTGLTTIGEQAFRWCTGLTSLTFPTGSALSAIGERAFYQCDKLNKIIIPKSIEEIIRSAIQDGTIPNTVTISFTGRKKN